MLGKRLCDKAEEEHDLMEYLTDPKYADLVNDPKWVKFLEKQDEFRANFATLGRTSVKGYEGKQITVSGVTINL
ncbi:unnamed protein product [Caenorhabditis bovis]|uniref:Uncharacterized protein n=1 Tax=Caenorhabditis bovis TaxID=2654633 RepID=A0A8S1EPQ0_9PELO|nr:unnamed protein product [Caenorhabditis bovis]